MFSSLLNKCRLVCTNKPGKELRYFSTVRTKFISISCELASLFLCVQKESSHLPCVITFCFKGRSCASSLRMVAEMLQKSKFLLYLLYSCYMKFYFYYICHIYVICFIIYSLYIYMYIICFLICYTFLFSQ